MTAQGKPDRCPTCDSERYRKEVCIPSLGYKLFPCWDSWHSSPVPAAAPNFRTITDPESGERIPIKNNAIEAAPQQDDDLGGYGDHGKLAQVLFRAPPAESVPSSKDAARELAERFMCRVGFADSRNYSASQLAPLMGDFAIEYALSQTAALAAERDQAKKLANIYHGQYTDLLHKRSRRAEELERSNSLLRERITEAEGLLKIISDPPHDCCGCEDHSKANADCCAYVNYHCPECIAGAYFEKENQ